MNLIAKKLSNEMGLMYGKSWTCFTGINFNSQENTFIWFSYREKHFIVFKQAIESTNSDPILEARKPNAKITVIEEGMAENMKNSVIDIAKQSISSFNDLDSIAKNIVKSLKEKYGLKWFCSVSDGANFKEMISIGIDYSICLLK
jgi:hypothetical protein